jgi:hypothetical protein
MDFSVQFSGGRTRDNILCATGLETGEMTDVRITKEKMRKKTQNLRTAAAADLGPLCPAGADGINCRGLEPDFSEILRLGMCPCRLERNLFVIFTNDLDLAPQQVDILKKFADNTKTGQTVASANMLRAWKPMSKLFNAKINTLFPY